MTFRNETEVDYAENVFRSATHSVFLPASVNERIKREAFLFYKPADAFKPADFVRAYRIEIDFIAQLKRNFPESLHAVAMKHNARIFLFYKFGDFINVVYRTRFVIDVND